VDIPNTNEYQVLSKKFESNKIIAMHVSQRLVYISGTNDTYVMISNVAHA